MKKFVLMHVGFEKPSAEIMQAWGAWFEKAGPQTVENIGYFMRGAEITKDGQSDLAIDRSAITGLTVINAERFEDAVALASENPFVSAIRVYEVQDPQQGKSDG